MQLIATVTEIFNGISCGKTRQGRYERWQCTELPHGMQWHVTFLKPMPSVMFENFVLLISIMYSIRFRFSSLSRHCIILRYYVASCSSSATLLNCTYIENSMNNKCETKIYFVRTIPVMNNFRGNTKEYLYHYSNYTP